MNSTRCAAQQFDLKGRITAIRPLGSGNINQTSLLQTDAGEKIVLQRLNSAVFPDPRLIMENLYVMLAHMERELKREAHRIRWQLPRIIQCRNGDPLYRSPEGDYWRAMSYIDQTVSHECVDNAELAHQAGVALGRFHRLTGNLDPEKLHDTLPGFHQSPGYLEQFDHASKNGKRRIASHPNAEQCAQFISNRRDIINILEKAQAAGRLRLRTIHGDPKVTNILFCENSGEPVCLVDLDTVKPGLILTDIGDFFRSICNPAGEESEDPDEVGFNIRFFEHGLSGYISEMKSLLTEIEVNYIFDSIRLITLELGIRFITDYLEGDTYFKTKTETHNLQRAKVQFKLVESIEKQEKEIRKIIKENSEEFRGHNT